MILYGAFDRHNYGDLLFPLVMHRVLSNKFPEKKIAVAGLIKSDLSKYNALPTISIKKAIKESNNNACIILAGGDVMYCKWLPAYSYLLSDFSFTILTRLFNRFLPNLTIFAIKRAIGLSSDTPFDIASRDRKPGMKLIYNSVGGTEVSNAHGNGATELATTLNEAHYVSVRDNFSSDHIKRIGGKVSGIFPDSATIMSSLFSEEEINRNTGKVAQGLINKLKGNYIVFQISSGHFAGLASDFASSINTIASELNLAVVFIAIGNAAGHSDSEGIERVRAFTNSEIRTEIYLDGGVFDLMNLIKNSKCYCGTSLHGLITSMAFHVPRVALLPKLRKQINYMSTWDLPQMPSGVLPKGLPSALKQAMSFEKTELIAQEQFITAKYMENFKRISSEIA